MFKVTEYAALMVNISKEASSVDPYQTAPDHDHHCLPKRLKIFQKTAKAYVFVICALRVNKCEFSVHTVRTFMKYTHVCAAQTT